LVSSLEKGRGEGRQSNEGRDPQHSVDIATESEVESYVPNNIKTRKENKGRGPLSRSPAVW